MDAAGSNAIADLLESAATGPSALIIEGEAGIGKTTLWLTALDHARERGFHVLSAQPSAAESVQAYASLADLLDGVDPVTWADFPAPQRIAIDQVLLRTDSDTPATDQRAVAAAFLSVIGLLAEESPVLLAVDDLQWLDASSARVVQFVARRLTGPVRLLGAERVEAGAATTVSWLRLARPDALRRIQVPPLPLGGLHAVLTEQLGRTFSRPTMTRILQISGGNPFYAIELARTLRDDAPLPEAALPGSLAELVQARISGLDSSVQELLLAAACAAAPTVELIARTMSTDAADVVRRLEDAEDNGIVGINGPTIRFTHPLLAQGVYTNAGPARRRRMHRRLAGLVGQPELRARHLALAATSLDPVIVAALDEAAEATRLRGAPAAAAELLDLAIGLGGDTPERRIRLAHHHFDAGDLGRARTLLDETIASSSGPLKAEALSLLSLVHSADDNLKCLDCLERALDDVGEDLALRVQILTTRAFFLLNVGDLAGALRSADDAVTHAERLDQPRLLSPALSMRVLLGMVRGDGVDERNLRRAMELEDRDTHTHISIRPSFHHVLVLGWAGRLAEAVQGMAAIRAGCLERGEETEVIIAAFSHVVGLVWLGSFGDAALIAEDAMERAQQTGGDVALMTALTMRAQLAAYAGRVDEARRDVADALDASQRTGGAIFAGWQLTILGFLEISLGNHQAALTTLQPLIAMLHAAPDATESYVAGFVPDAVEALVALGRLDDAEPLIVALERNGARLDRAWMLAIGARCRAMVLAAQGDFGGANVLAQQSMTEHERLPMPFERARTQLLLGQLQRRSRHKEAASATLQEALSAFEEFGTPLWAERTRLELGRVDIGPRRTTGLTPSEQRVAELAAAGMTNRDVAATLFISPKTVEANLSRIYHKLGIRSRAQLGQRIGQSNGGAG